LTAKHSGSWETGHRFLTIHDSGKYYYYYVVVVALLLSPVTGLSSLVLLLNQR
jgi:hypothetical protein